MSVLGSHLRVTAPYEDWEFDGKVTVAGAGVQWVFEVVIHGQEPIPYHFDEDGKVDQETWKAYSKVVYPSKDEAMEAGHAYFRKAVCKLQDFRRLIKFNIMEMRP